MDVYSFYKILLTKTFSHVIGEIKMRRRNWENSHKITKPIILWLFGSQKLGGELIVAFLKCHIYSTHNFEIDKKCNVLLSADFFLNYTLLHTYG